MEKIKKILTDPQYAKYWREVSSDICGIPTEYAVRYKLKKLGLNKKFLEEYADIYYIMSVINYVSCNEYDKDFVWKDKDKLVLEETNKGEIEHRKRSIFFDLRDLKEYGEVDEETMNSILATLGIEDKEEDDEEKFLNAIFR